MSQKLIRYNYLQLADDGLFKIILEDSINATTGLMKPGSLFKVEPEFTRPFTKLESYLGHCGYCTAHYLSYLQQLNHIRIFVNESSVTRNLKRNNINGYNTLLYHIENFIVRTQGILDRTSILVDAIMNLGNNSEFINYNLIKSNYHVKQTRVDIELKKLRKTTEHRHHIRNKIIHEQHFMDDELRALEGFYNIYEWRVLSQKTEGNDDFYKDIKFNEKLIRAKWTKSIDEFINSVYPIIKSLLIKLEPVYENNKRILH